MKFIKTAGLLAVLAALSAYVYFVEIKGGEEREKLEEQQEKLFHFKTDSVVSVKIKSLISNFNFVKMDEGWQINEPVRTGADENTVTGMLNTLSNLKKDRQFDVNKNELKDYGLTNRALKVELLMNDGTKDSLYFGDDTPVGSNMFVNKVDTVVYTVPKSTRNQVNKKLFDWRDKAVAHVKSSEIREFKLKNEKGRFHLVKEGVNWKITSPREVKAENSVVTAVLRKFESGRIKTVAAEKMDSPRNYSLHNPAYEVELMIGPGKAIKRVIFSRLSNNTAFGKDESRDHVFTVDSLFIRDINKSFYQLRDKKLFTFTKDDIDSMVVFQDDTTYTMVKDTSAKWYFSSGEQLKDWKMNSILNSLGNLRLQNFLAENVKDYGKYGLKNAGLKFDLFNNGDLVANYMFGGEKDENRVVFCPQAETAGEVEKRNYDNLKIKADEFIEDVKEEEESS